MKPTAKRLLLIEPPFYRLYNNRYSLTRLPLSLGYLAGVVKRDTNWQVFIYNADFSPEDKQMEMSYLTGPGFEHYLRELGQPGRPIWHEVKGVILRHNPSVVGITATSANYASACIVADIAKSVDPDIVVVLGGSHATASGVSALRHPSIDFGVVGEGELTLVELLRALDGRLPIESVRGIVYQNSHRAMQGLPRPLMTNLDSLPFPATVAEETLYNYHSYPSRSFTNILATRGCANHCSFCGSRNLWTRRVRFRSVDNVLAEISEIKKRPASIIRFDDDTFGVTKPYLLELCSGIADRFPKLTWDCEIHVSLINEHIIKHMKEAGCRSVYLGVESGSNDILRQVRKGFTLEQALKVANIIRSHKIRLATFFMVGFPQETKETLTDTIKAIRTFPCDSIVYSIFTPYLGTELFNLCKRLGLISDDFDGSRFNHQSPLNYFCPNVPKDWWLATLRKLEREIDKINSRRRLRWLFSTDVWRKLTEYGPRMSISRLRQTLKTGFIDIS